jgi:hypothetical protein
MCGLQYTKETNFRSQSSRPSSEISKYIHLKLCFSNICKRLSDSYRRWRSKSHDNVNLHLQMLFSSHRSPHVILVEYGFQRLKYEEYTWNLGAHGVGIVNDKVYKRIGLLLGHLHAMLCRFENIRSPKLHCISHIDP